MSRRTEAGRPRLDQRGHHKRGAVTWDYPFVDGLMQLADDVRSVFDRASLTKDLSGYEYWVTDGNNATVGGVKMIETVHRAAGARRSASAGLVSDVPGHPDARMVRNLFAGVLTGVAIHVSGPEVRAAKYAAPNWSIELNFDLLRMAAPNTELQAIISFFEQCRGEDLPFLFELVPLSPVSAQPIGTGDGSMTTFYFAVSIGSTTITPATVSVAAIYLADVLQSTGYSLSTTAFATAVTFTVPSAAGVAEPQI